MGCSYDPVRRTIYPSPAELWMEENKFSEIKRSSGYGTDTSYCQECGVVLLGTRYGPRFLKLHISVCPVTPRQEISEKTEEECKNYPREIWV